MQRFLIILALLCAVVLTVQADRRRLLMARQAQSSACATADTTLPHDTLLEGFQVSAPSYYETNWSIGGTGGGLTLNADADTTSLTTGKPAGACDQALQMTIAQTDTQESSIYWDYGSAIDVDTVSVDLFCYIYVSVIPDGAEDVTFLSFKTSTSPDASSGSSARIIIKADGSNFALLANGTTSSSDVTGLAVNTWHKLQLHIDATAASSSLTVNDGTPVTFTRRATTDPRYLHFGSLDAAISGDSVTMFVDLVTLDFP